jgi:hypothetical protein
LKGESPFHSRPARTNLTRPRTTSDTGSLALISSRKDGGNRMGFQCSDSARLVKAYRACALNSQRETFSGFYFLSFLAAKAGAQCQRNQAGQPRLGAAPERVPKGTGELKMQHCRRKHCRYQSRLFSRYKKTRCGTPGNPLPPVEPLIFGKIRLPAVALELRIEMFF